MAKVGAVVGVVVGLVAVLIIVLVSTSLKRLDSFEVGLAYDTVWKKLSEKPQNEGLHSGAPGFQFIIFPSVFKTIEFPTLQCLNKDGVDITLDVSYQYKAQAGELHSIVMEFKDHDEYLEVLEAAGQAAIHETCSLFNTSQFQAERGRFQSMMGEKLAERYTELKCDVSEIQVSNIARPSEYESAIQAKEAARENIKVAENERPRQITQAQTRKREADTQAEITVAKAKSQARIRQTQADAEAVAILNQFDTEATTYEELMSNAGLSLTNTGFLSYMGVRTIASAKNPVYIGLKAPAKSSYVTN